MRRAELYSNSVDRLDSTLVDLRETRWAPLPSEKLTALITQLRAVIHEPKELKQTLARLQAASNPAAPKPQLGACLAHADTPFACKKRFDPDSAQQTKEFTRQLHAYLYDLACKSPDFAQGITNRLFIPGFFLDHLFDSLLSFGENSALNRKELQTQLKKRLDDPTCFGLYGLSAEEKNRLRALLL